jgi:hypothetical protein
MSCFQESSCSWIVPGDITGNWTGNLKVSVRYRVHLHYYFVSAPDSVRMTIKINENGSVNGTFGTAFFDGCRVIKNRGWLRKKLNLATDYCIEGAIKGSIFPGDTLSDFAIMLPFDLKAGTISGDIYQKEGFDKYPMANVKLGRQKHSL